MSNKPRLLIISSVYPFPRNAGQQQRVYYTLRALRPDFHLTFLTVADYQKIEDVRKKLLELCDDAIILPSAYAHSFFSRLVHKSFGMFYNLFTGLKFSNYQYGEVEFSQKRIAPSIAGRNFDGVLFEYWHAFKIADFFRQKGSVTILDMHDILWRSYARQLDARKQIPAGLKNWMVNRYQAREEAAWNDFDILIAINQDELDYARQHTRPNVRFIYTPMGTDISTWSYCWQPADSPRRVAYYGSLGSAHNQQDALLCYREIMPVIWEKFPTTEFWVVGNNPPPFIKNLEHDPRVHVTGFVETPQDVLKSMSLVLCPWSGIYGFRSRVVEVMALGVPVVASYDAVHGMGFEEGNGIVLDRTPAAMAEKALGWLFDANELRYQSLLARSQMENKFSYEATYVEFSHKMSELLRK